MQKEELERINQLARKKQTEGLSDEESDEQQKLHAKYLEFVRNRVKTQLEEAGHQPKQN